MKLKIFALFIATLPLSAIAEDTIQYDVAAGASSRGANFALGFGDKTDVIEVNSVKLGYVTGAASAKFIGVSLVQHADPINGFDFLFRVGFGRATSRFDTGATATRGGLSNGLFVGIGEEYQPGRHFLLRVEADRISFAKSPDGNVTGVRYPITASGVLIF
jgi:hypothetical protein